MDIEYLTFLTSCLQKNHKVYTLKQLVEKETGPKELPPNLQSSTVLEAPLHVILSTREDVREVVETYLFDHIHSKIIARRKREEEQFESLFADSDEEEADEEEQPKPSKDVNIGRAITKKRWLNVKQSNLNATLSYRDSQLDNIESYMCDVEIDNEKWEEDILDEKVCLKVSPNAIQVPVHLFSNLYEHQHTGIEWLAGLWLKGKGGIIAE